jgi:hypothetical protein
MWVACPAESVSMVAIAQFDGGRPGPHQVEAPFTLAVNGRSVPCWPNAAIGTVNRVVRVAAKTNLGQRFMTTLLLGPE